MNKLISALVALPLLGSQMGLAQSDAGGPTLGAVEIHMCDYKKGKSAKDLDKAIGRWNEWADESELVPYNAWTLTPVYGSPEYDFDVAWLGAWQHAADMGKALQHWSTGDHKMQAEFDKVVSCNANAVFFTTNFKPLEGDWPKTGVTTFADCNYAEGKGLVDSIKVQSGWAAHLTERGSKAATWGFYPAFGGGAGNASYKVVTAHADFESLGADQNDYTNGGSWEQAEKLAAGKVSCGVPRVYMSTLQRNGGVSAN